MTQVCKSSFIFVSLIVLSLIQQVVLEEVFSRDYYKHFSGFHNPDLFKGDDVSSDHYQSPVPHFGLPVGGFSTSGSKKPYGLMAYYAQFHTQPYKQENDLLKYSRFNPVDYSDINFSHSYSSNNYANFDNSNFGVSNFNA